jgi:hypothetical protein
MPGLLIHNGELAYADRRFKKLLDQHLARVCRRDYRWNSKFPIPKKKDGKLSPERVVQVISSTIVDFRG